jgi:predicted RNase H-like nuclease
MALRVLGVDACKAGWVGVTVHDGEVSVRVARTVETLVADSAADGELAAIGIDIPIGLPDAGRRQADVLAYAYAGPRRSSVFMAPVRAALEAGSHAAAIEVNRALAGQGVSAQAYGLRSKILEVDAWVRHAGRRVVEVHPELSFGRLAGSPLPDGKRTWAGAQQRWRLLADAGICLAGDLGRPGRHAAVDDVLDAGAAAWTAGRVATGVATPLPDPPVVHSDGWPAAIWI